MPDHSLFRLRVLPCCVALAMSGSYVNAWAENEIQFDSRFLELKGDTKIDLKRFSSQGYVEPGKYNLQVQLNKQPLTEEYDIYWYASENDASKTYACLTPELVAQFGLKEDVAKNLQWIHDGKCLKPGQLEGIDIKADLSQSALVISLPQAYLEYTDINWDPPSRWDDGISGLIADYSITAQTRHEENGGDDSNEISGNGTVGVNLGAWRLRADWQTDYLHSKSNDDDVINGDDTQKNWEWSRYYAWRALPSLKAKLGLGEDYLNSDIFDGFNYVGGSISTDDQMLPPNLRGYAPDISGVAHTTAKVTVSQLGRVIYETQVPAGPFRIQDLGDSVSGTLHIRIEEQN
ncbi:fimbria/pilus outer membrane usher protein, partial [Escherichia coli]